MVNPQKQRLHHRQDCLRVDLFQSPNPATLKILLAVFTRPRGNGNQSRFGKFGSELNSYSSNVLQITHFTTCLPGSINMSMVSINNKIQIEKSSGFWLKAAFPCGLSSFLWGTSLLTNLRIIELSLKTLLTICWADRPLWVDKYCSWLCQRMFGVGCTRCHAYHENIKDYWVLTFRLPLDHAFELSIF